MDKVKDCFMFLFFLLAIVFASGAIPSGSSNSKGDSSPAHEVNVPPYSPPAEEAHLITLESQSIAFVASAEAPDEEASDKEKLEPLYSERDVELMAKVIWAEARGVTSDAEKAAVAWCALNRLDAGTYGDTLEAVLTAPWQFAYYESSPVTQELEALARDVLDRWQAEQRGAENVGRTLPEDYFFFEGDGIRNHFRKNYEKTGATWDWSLPDPYEE